MSPRALALSAICAIYGLSPVALAEEQVGGAVGAEAAAAPSPTAQCLDAHEQSQVARSDGRLMDARKQLLLCSRSSCPTLIQSDCARWFDEVEEMVPTLVVAVRRGGEDVPKAELQIDGKVVANTLNGQELPVDPGPHEVIVTVPGEAKPLSRQIMVARGEKHRLVNFALEVPESERPASAATSAPAPEVPMHRPIPTLTYVLGGAAIGLAAGGGFFGMRALSEKDALAAAPADGGCKPNCTDQDMSAMRTNAWISNGLFVGSAATAIGALITYVWRPAVPVEGDEAADKAEKSDKPASARLRGQVQFAATPTGGFIGYGGQF